MSSTTETGVARQMLQTYEGERDALLQRIQDTIEQDTRIVGAWIFGSLGRGTQDPWSDLDIWLVVEDADLDTLVTNRRNAVAQAGELLAVVEAPQNAPAGGGGYLMALYAGEFGPHQVDWYWQARSLASIPQQTRLLLERVGMPHAETPTQFSGYGPVPERTPEEAVEVAINFFWAMWMIMAKYAVRSPYEEKMGLVKYVVGPLREVQAFLDVPLTLEDDAPHPDPATKLRILRDLAHKMEALMPQAEARGVPIPAALTPYAHRYLAFIETCIEAGPLP